MKVDLEYRSERGALPSPDELLRSHPSLRDDPECLVEILAWASRLENISRGANASGFDLESLAKKFPDLKDEIVGRRATLYRALDPAYPSDLVPEDCTLIGELTHGGMSRVLLVWNENSGREEVVKLNDPLSAGRADLVGRFIDEIKLAGSLTSGQVVPVFSAGKLGGHLYYTMPYLRGGSFGSRLEQGRVSLREGVIVLREVARAVETLHLYAPDGRVTPIIHRDLKPGNILFPGPGLDNPKISDLGLAKLLDDLAGPRRIQTENRRIAWNARLHGSRAG